VRGGFCDEHAREADVQRGTRYDRGYGTEHDRVRKTLYARLRAAERRGEQMLCWRCGCTIHSRQRLAADHSGVAAGAGGVADCLVHTDCNSGKRVLNGAPCTFAHK
jgi:hypothetical protein